MAFKDLVVKAVEFTQRQKVRRIAGTVSAACAITSMAIDGGLLLTDLYASNHGIGMHDPNKIVDVTAKETVVNSTVVDEARSSAVAMDVVKNIKYKES